MANPCLCSIPDCGKTAKARGWCDMHYWRNRTYGNPLHVNQSVRTIVAHGEIARVPLTRGFEAIIDSADAPLVQGRNWRVVPNHSGINYVVSSLPGNRRLALHRLLMNPPDDMIVDHINGDALDNRRTNLRVATQSQNCMNKRPRKTGSSRYKGVAWDKNTRKWQACIRLEDGQKYLGQYLSEEEAFAAYRQAAEKHFGEFARFT